MKVIFAGTPDFAVPCLRALSAGHDVSLVVTRPDRPKGRGRHLAASPVKETALQLGLPVFQPRNVNDPASLARIREIAPDVVIVVSYGQKIGAELLRLPRKGCYNLHPSLLPRYRGAAPVEWSLMSGESETGVTVILMTDRMDAGQIAAQSRTAVRENENAGQLKARLAEEGAALLLTALQKLEDGSLTLQPQDESMVTRARKLTKQDGLLSWSLPAEELTNFVRGVTPWPGAFGHLRSGSRKGAPLRVVIKEAEPVDFTGGDAAPGEIVSVEPDLIVAAGDGAVKLKLLQPAGKKAMSAEAFLRGHTLQPGDRFSEEG